MKCVVTDVFDNSDGKSCTVVFDMDEEFKSDFKRIHGLKRWSAKKFQREFLASIELMLKERTVNSTPDSESSLV